MDFRLTKEQQDLREEFNTFFKEEMQHAPRVFRECASELEASLAWNEGWEFHRYLQKKLSEKGWSTMDWPREYGGRDAPIIEQLIFNEARAYHRAPGVDIAGVKMFAPTLMLFASEEQKKRLLPPIAMGEVHYSQGWSEPNAGSDLASLRTTAIKDGDYYIINGQKIWSSGAHRADHMFLLARTDPSQKRSRGLSVFNIKLDTPGIEIRPILFMDGRHHYNEVFFSDVRIHEDDRIGAENDGWRSTRETMNFERSGIGYFVSTKRWFEDLLAHVKTTKRDGKYLSENPIIRQKLAKIYIDAEVGKALAYKTAWLQEKGDMLTSAAASSEGKVFGSELRQRLANFATEILGLYGQVRPSPWAPLNGAMAEDYQACVGSNIAGGTSEIQRNIIAWVGVGLPRIK